MRRSCFELPATVRTPKRHGTGRLLVARQFISLIRGMRIGQARVVAEADLIPVLEDPSPGDHGSLDPCAVAAFEVFDDQLTRLDAEPRMLPRDLRDTKDDVAPAGSADDNGISHVESLRLRAEMSDQLRHDSRVRFFKGTSPVRQNSVVPKKYLVKSMPRGMPIADSVTISQNSELENRRRLTTL